MRPSTAAQSLSTAVQDLMDSVLCVSSSRESDTRSKAVMKEIQSSVCGISPMFFCGSCVSDKSNKAAVKKFNTASLKLVQCSDFEISPV